MDVLRVDKAKDECKLALVHSVVAAAGNCMCIAVDPTNKCFATGSYDGITSIWDNSDLVCIRPACVALEDSILSLDFSFDGVYLAGCSEIDRNSSQRRFIDIVRNPLPTPLSPPCSPLLLPASFLLFSLFPSAPSLPPHPLPPFSSSFFITSCRSLPFFSLSCYPSPSFLSHTTPPLLHILHSLPMIVQSFDDCPALTLHPPRQRR